MGKQINFLMDFETECFFKNHILQQGEILFEGKNSEPVSITELPTQFSGKGWFSVYLYKKELGELIFEKLSKDRKYINCTKSPVIEFTRTVIRDNEKEVSFGRLWVEMKYWSDNEELTKKPKELYEWYINLQKWIKINMPKTKFSINNKIYNEHASTEIKNIIEKGYKIF
ncbi:MAG: hypothetical protein KAZ87_06510 [Spirochaetes bacterium]|nr:hypothetical protein [Spirochaetota bacterium]